MGCADSDNWVVPQSHARLLWRTSWCALVSAIYATTLRKYDFAALSSIAFLTSLNHWRAPLYSWRRRIDICAVYIALSYHLYKASAAEYGIAYFALTGAGVTSYFAGVLLYDQKYMLSSVYAHAAVHVFANIANIILYSGS